MNLATVSLLLDVEELGKYPNLTRSSTGEPMTADEVAAVGKAGWVELRAVRDYYALAAEDAQAAADGFGRIVELLGRYGFDTGVNVLGGEMRARMSPEDFAEVATLLQRFGGAT